MRAAKRRDCHPRPESSVLEVGWRLIVECGVQPAAVVPAFPRAAPRSPSWVCTHADARADEQRGPAAWPCLRDIQGPRGALGRVADRLRRPRRARTGGVFVGNRHVEVLGHRRLRAGDRSHRRRDLCVARRRGDGDVGAGGQRMGGRPRPRCAPARPIRNREPSRPRARQKGTTRIQDAEGTAGRSLRCERPERPGPCRRSAVVLTQRCDLLPSLMSGVARKSVTRIPRALRARRGLRSAADASARDRSTR
jgi:hypothetical protein